MARRQAPGPLATSLAALGYLAWCCACLIGTAGVFAVLGAMIVVDLMYGVWTGTVRARLGKKRW